MTFKSNKYSFSFLLNTFQKKNPKIINKAQIEK